MKPILLAILLTLVMATDLSAGFRLPTGTKAAYSGVGPIRVGMTLKELRAAIGESLAADEPDEYGCSYALPNEGCNDVLILLTDGVVRLISIFTPEYSTVSGARVGDTEKHVQDIYHDRLVVTAHSYVDGHYLTLTSHDGKYALVFETADGVITSYRIGRYPEVGYIEGCS